MKRLWLVAVLFLSLSGAPAEGQEATITINGYAFGQIAGLQHECPIRANGRVEGYVGLQVSCPVWAVDGDGNFTPSSVAAVPGDSGRVAVRVSHVAQDTLGRFVADTLHITVLRQGNWMVTLTARPILFIMGHAYMRTEDATWPRHEFPPIRAVVGEEFALCAYQGGYEDATAKSLSRPIPCPDLGGAPLPEFEVRWTLPDVLGPVDPVAVPGSVMAELSRRMDEVGVAYVGPGHPVTLRAVGAVE
jgi:hypothetical protein